MSVGTRTLLVIAHDLAAVVLAWALALALSGHTPMAVLSSLQAWSLLLLILPVKAFFFRLFGLYKGIWRFASLPDLIRILKAVFASAGVLVTLLWMATDANSIPRSAAVLDPLVLLLLMGGSRMAYRVWKERRIAARLHADSRPVLVLGAGSAADFILRELARNPVGFRVVGLLDDDVSKHGRHIQDVPVLGPLSELEHHAHRLGVREVVMALPTASIAKQQALRERCRQSGLQVLTIPSLEDLMQGRVTVNRLRRVHWQELLGREPVRLDDEGLATWLRDEVVLVTGGGGSIGAELCHQLARFRPSRLVVLELSEYALYSIEQALRSSHPQLDVVAVIGDIKDAPAMRALFLRHHPKIVFHAAAYKHVPIMEENAFEALKNNVLGTYTVARAACDAGVEKFVMVSTDKAVNPTNVMGASKRLAEMVCQVLQSEYVPTLSAVARTRFVSVRFGNVLGSSGSVIPKFQAQIEAGGPVTVTHPEVTRYFMSIPEAAQLVLQAGFMGQGGEIFVLDMGEPVRIADLARLMIKLAGRTEEEIGIVYTGLRPGEKLYEEPLADDEGTLPTPHPKLRVARSRPAEATRIRDALDWVASTPVASSDEVRARLAAWLPEFRPTDVTSALAVLPLDRTFRTQAQGNVEGHAVAGCQ
jgi:FlaA1/EpsC-like NDP-sugar epimerase